MLKKIFFSVGVSFWLVSSLFGSYGLTEETAQNTETITLQTYYPSPLGYYQKIKAATMEAQVAAIGKLTPSYDSDWVAFPLVKKGQARFYLLELSHRLGTIDTFVQIETRNDTPGGRENLEKAVGYTLLPYGPGVYSLVSGVPAVSFPTYTKDENRIVITMAAIPGSDDEQYSHPANGGGSIAVLARGHATGKWRPEGSSLDEKIYIRVVMQRY